MNYFACAIDDVLTDGNDRKCQLRGVLVCSGNERVVLTETNESESEAGDTIWRLLCELEARNFD
jgi:hypothetical protein